MSIDIDQLRQDIVSPVLKKLELWSLSAENLILGTAAQESALGTYVRQLGGGPALGIYQMEPTTYYDLWTNYIRRKPKLYYMLSKVCSKCGKKDIPDASELMYNLAFATAMTRIHYLRIPELLPQHNSTKDLALYWKRYYNTPKGKGTVEEFIDNYKRYVIRET